MAAQEKARGTTQERDGHDEDGGFHGARIISRKPESSNVAVKVLCGARARPLAERGGIARMPLYPPERMGPDKR